MLEYDFTELPWNSENKKKDDLISQESMTWQSYPGTWLENLMILQSLAGKIP